MGDQRFYIVTKVDEKLAVITETAAQFTVKGCPQWAYPEDVADAIRASEACFDLKVDLLSAADLDRSKPGRDAVGRWDKRDDSLWRVAARERSARDVRENLVRLRDEGGDQMAGIVLEEGTLKQQVRYSLRFV